MMLGNAQQEQALAEVYGRSVWQKCNAEVCGF
jgi:hypothetical protein